MDGALQRLAEPGTALQWQIVKLTVMFERCLAAHDGAHDVDIFACASQRLGIRLAVPTFHHLRARCADAEDHATARQVIERHCRHCGGGRSACTHLHDAGAEFDVGGLRTPPRQRSECIAAVGLGGPQRMETELVGFLHRFHHACWRT